MKKQVIGAIVAMTRRDIIGIDGHLPWEGEALREDLFRFRGVTSGHPIIMGRVTWDSLGCEALPGRRNIVVSRSKVEGVEHYHNVEDAIKACTENEVWVIGGAQIYEAALPYLNRLDITYMLDIPNPLDDERLTIFPKVDYNKWHVTWWEKANKGITEFVFKRRVFRLNEEGCIYE